MNKAVFAALGTAVLTTAASADITGAIAVSYSKTVAEFDGSSVTVGITDLYMTSDDAADTLLNVYDFNLNSSAPASFYQATTGVGWRPTNLGGPFDNEAVRQADSFVTIGGFGLSAEQAPGAGGDTGLDPSFGGNDADAPGVNAGWFNSNPPSAQGLVGETAVGLGVLIGRFSVLGSEGPDLIGTELKATWNQGLGSPGSQAQFSVAAIPAPGALALLGLAGLTGRRRRG